MLSCTQECKGIKTFIYEGIDEQFLEYPENFRIFIFGLPEPSVKFYIGLIDDATYLVQNFEVEYHGRIEWSASRQMECNVFFSLFNIKYVLIQN